MVCNITTCHDTEPCQAQNPRIRKEIWKKKVNWYVLWAIAVEIG